VKGLGGRVQGLGIRQVAVAVATVVVPVRQAGPTLASVCATVLLGVPSASRLIRREPIDGPIDGPIASKWVAARRPYEDTFASVCAIVLLGMPSTSRLIIIGGGLRAQA
jgi:hypothetical protein